MKPSWVLAIVTLGAAVSGLWFVTRGPHPRGDGAGPSAADESVSSPAPGSGATTSTGDATRDPAPEPIGNAPFLEVSSPEPEPAPTTATAAPALAPGAEWMVIEGRVIVTDRERELRSPSGRFRLWSTIGGHDVTVQVTGGRFRASLPRAVKFSVSAAVFDTASADAESEEITVTAGEPLVLRFRLRKAVTLRVLGEGTRTDLSNVVVLRAPSEEFGIAPHPGTGGKEVLRGVDSPVILPPFWESYSGNQKAWIGAEGFAFVPFQWASAAGGEFQVRLPRGGGLEVALSGPPAPEAAVVRLRRHEPEDAVSGRPESEALVENGKPLRLDGLRPGRYAVTVEVGGWGQHPQCLGRADGDVRKGEVTPITVALESDMEMLASVPVSGTLVLPPEWGLKTVGLWFHPDASIKALVRTLPHAEVERSLPATGTTDTFLWSVPSMMPGRWELRVDPIYHRSWVEIPREGTDSLHIEVAPPAEVQVRVVDSRTVRAVGVDRIEWIPDLEYSNGGSLERVTPDADCRFDFRVPVGWIEIHVHPEGYSWAQQPLEVQPGVNALEVKVTRTSGVSIRLREGDVDLSPEDVCLDLTNDRTGDQASASFRKEKRCTITGIAPGPCTLKLPVIPGYKPVAPIPVEVREGEITDVVILLERVR